MKPSKDWNHLARRLRYAAAALADVNRALVLLNPQASLPVRGRRARPLPRDGAQPRDRAAVLDVVLCHGPSTAQQVADHLEDPLPRPHVEAILAHLASCRLVVLDAAGRWDRARKPGEPVAR